MRINHGYDFLVEAVFQTMCDAEFFREHITQEFGVKTTQTHYVIEELKEEGVLLNHIQ